MPTPVKCPTCTTKIPHPSIRSDAERSFPLAGEPREGQNVVACLCCGQLLHAQCVREASTLVSWKHLWFSNPGMRTLIEERGLFGLDVALCQRCRDDLLEQILGNYRALLEGARFRGDLGTTQDVPRRRERWGGLATYSSALLLGRAADTCPRLPGFGT